MSEILYRLATAEDIVSLTNIRAKHRETTEFWIYSISSYLDNSRSPQKALKTRIIYTASINAIVIGFISGHLSTRYGCQGELQWLDVLEEYRRQGIATELLNILLDWFRNQNAYKICVDPGDEIARGFYISNGAKNLNEHWLHWENIKVNSLHKMI